VTDNANVNVDNIQKPPSAFKRAEASTRRLMLSLGLGMVSVFIGAVITVHTVDLLLPLVNQNANLLFVLSILIERLWHWFVLSAFGYFAGRVLRVEPRSFAFVSSVSGETFSFLILMAMSGIESMNGSDFATRAIGFLVGLFLVTQATRIGLKHASKTDQQALDRAKETKAEYDAFLKAAEGTPTVVPQVEPETAAPQNALVKTEEPKSPSE
jgi:hypothetical protein